METHTIISSQFKFILRNFTRSIENTGGFPIIKYTSHPINASIINWAQCLIRNPPPTGILYSMGTTELITCNPGTEILLIGDTIHFPAEFPLVVPGYISNYISIEV